MRYTDEGGACPERHRRALEPSLGRLLPGYSELDGLPVPVRWVLATSLLPLDAALTSVGILRNTEALLGELVFHLRALRPAVAATSQAYANGQFAPVFKTFDQIQRGTHAIGVICAPLSAVCDVFVPGPARRQPAAAAPPAAPAAPGRSMTVEWLGGIGSRMLDQAATLPGGDLVPGLRRLRSPMRRLLGWT